MKLLLSIVAYALCAFPSLSMAQSKSQNDYSALFNDPVKKQPLLLSDLPVRKDAEQGNPQAQCHLGRRYYDGVGVTQNRGEAVKWWRMAANQGNAAAQFALGCCYGNGEGVPKDSTEAVKWFRKAAEHGHTIAQSALGNCLYEGRGVTKDFTEGAKWFRKAAEQGDVNAQDHLGYCYERGEGVSKNFAIAFKWYHKAAEQGSAHAQAGLGNFYHQGRGTMKNLEDAVKWYRMSANQGNPAAQCALGYCYDRGEGVLKNSSEAVKWFRKAANQGEPSAQTNLGLLYANGSGVVKNEVEAYMWWLLAAGQGMKQAKDNMAISEARLTREQIAEGQKLARNFKQRKEPDLGANASGDKDIDSNVKYTGTGFFITKDGFLVTNNHVIKGANSIRVGTSQGTIIAKVVKVDSINDIALLKAEGMFEILPVISSRSVKLGSSVITVGFPNINLQGFAPKFSKGDIAALSGPADDGRYFQISAPVQPGNSGGALVDEYGNVVGVVVAKLNASAALATSGSLPENVNYAVKSSFLLGFLEAVPTVVSKLQEPSTKEAKFADVVKSVERASVVVFVY